jgi:hypothetical protein
VGNFYNCSNNVDKINFQDYLEEFLETQEKLKAIRSKLEEIESKFPSNFLSDNPLKTNLHPMNKM